MNNITKKVFTGKYDELEDKLNFSNDFILKNTNISINKQNLNLSEIQNNNYINSLETDQNETFKFIDFPKIDSINSKIIEPIINKKSIKYCSELINNNNTEIITNTNEHIIAFTYQGNERSYTEYIIHFTQDIEATILVVGGGGGGGYNRGSGGGAGGVIFEEKYNLYNKDYVIRVGKGGNGGTDENNMENGIYSYFEYLQPSQYAYGGGAGRPHTLNNLYTINSGKDNGGSGGGGQGIGIFNQGTIGGKHSDANSSGGGGAGQSGFDGYGTDSTPLFSGNGGIGIDLSSYFGKNVGEYGWFAGGGGGSIHYDSYGYETIAGKGGNGGGGDAGQKNKKGLDAIPNTGSGGGGGGNINARQGGNGSSGIVIIKYYSPIKLHYIVDPNEKKEMKIPKQIGLYGKTSDNVYGCNYLNSEESSWTFGFFYCDLLQYNSSLLNEKTGIYIKYEKPTIINNLIFSYASVASQDPVRIRIDGSYDNNIDFSYNDNGKKMTYENGNWITINYDLILDRYTEQREGNWKENNQGNGIIFTNNKSFIYYRIIFLETVANTELRLSTIKFLGPFDNDYVKILDKNENVIRRKKKNSNKWYIEFNTDGSDNSSTDYIIKYKTADSGSLLIVGGGGGGATGSGGGGGGGGTVVYSNNINFSENSIFNIKVGKGANKTNNSSGNKGEISQFENIIAEGGGGGGKYNTSIDITKSNGGSGGGGGGNSNDYGLKQDISTEITSSLDISSLNYYMNDGNIGSTNDSGGLKSKWDLLGGGGGGAGQRGHNGRYIVDTDVWRAGDGGDGIMIDITGEKTYYAGGGGSISNNTDIFTSMSNGGLGGGGKGGINLDNFLTYKTSDGENGKGGGGGAVRNTNGSKGGDGIVILEYSDENSLNIYSSPLDRIYPPTKKIYNKIQKIDNIRYNNGNSLGSYINYGNGTYKIKYSNEEELNIEKTDYLPYNVFSDLYNNSKTWLKNNYLNGIYKYDYNNLNNYLQENGINIFKLNHSDSVGTAGDWIHIELPKLIYLKQIKIKINLADLNNSPKKISLYGGINRFAVNNFNEYNNSYYNDDELDVEKTIYHKLYEIDDIEYNESGEFIENSFDLINIETDDKHKKYDNFLLIVQKLQGVIGKNWKITKNTHSNYQYTGSISSSIEKEFTDKIKYQIGQGVQQEDINIQLTDNIFNDYFNEYTWFKLTIDDVEYNISSDITKLGETLKIKEIEIFGFEELALKTDFSLINNSINENDWQLIGMQSTYKKELLKILTNDTSKNKKYTIGSHNLNSATYEEYFNTAIDTENNLEFTEIMFTKYIELTYNQKVIILNNIRNDINININNININKFESRDKIDVKTYKDFIEMYKLINNFDITNYNTINITNKDVLKINIENINTSNYIYGLWGEYVTLTEWEEINYSIPNYYKRLNSKWLEDNLDAKNLIDSKFAIFSQSDIQNIIREYDSDGTIIWDITKKYENAFGIIIELDREYYIKTIGGRYFIPRIKETKVIGLTQSETRFNLNNDFYYPTNDRITRIDGQTINNVKQFKTSNDLDGVLGNNWKFINFIYEDNQSGGTDPILRFVLTVPEIKENNVDPNKIYRYKFKIYESLDINTQLFAWWKLDTGDNEFIVRKLDSSNNDYTLIDPLIDQQSSNKIVKSSGSYAAFGGLENIQVDSDLWEFKHTLQLYNEIFNDNLNNQPFSISFKCINIINLSSDKAYYFLTILEKNNEDNILLYLKYSFNSIKFGFNGTQNSQNVLANNDDELTFYYGTYEDSNIVPINFVFQIHANGNREIWMNGINVASDTTSLLNFAPEDYHLVIGNERSQSEKIFDTGDNIGSNSFHGKLKDLRFYSDALTEYEIYKIYNINEYDFLTESPITEININSYYDSYIDTSIKELYHWMVCNSNDIIQSLNKEAQSINGELYYIDVPILRSSISSKPYKVNWKKNNNIVSIRTNYENDIDNMYSTYHSSLNTNEIIYYNDYSFNINIKYAMFSRNVEDFEYLVNKKTNSDNWRLVRYLPELAKTDILTSDLPYFHPSTDQLGKLKIPITYGNITDYTDPWSTYFGSFDEYLFATGNLNYWLIMNKYILNGNHNGVNLDIIDSYLTEDFSKKYKSIIYNRNASTEDPLIAIKGNNSKSQNKYLYAGNAYNANSNNNVNTFDIINDKGLLVFVRNNTNNYNYPYEYKKKGGDGIILDCDEKYLKVWYNFTNNFNDENPSNIKHNIIYNGNVKKDIDSIYGLSAKFTGGTSNEINDKGYLKITEKFNIYDLWKDNGITISLFYKFNESANWCGLFEFSIDDRYEDRIALLQNATSDKLQAIIVIDDNSFMVDIANNKVLHNKWHHIVWIIDILGNWIIYVDGLQENFNLNCPLPNKFFNKSYFGKRTDSSKLFSGNLDDIRIYSNRLYYSDIFSIYNLLNQNLTYINNVNNLTNYQHTKFSKSWYDNRDGYTCIVYENNDNTIDHMEYNLNFENRVDAHVLIMGGGGSGGKGGGGASGEIIFFRELLDAGHYNIKVGKGGISSSSASGTGIGQHGFYSQFNNIKAYGGSSGQRETVVGGVYGCGGGNGYDDEEFHPFYINTIKYIKDDNTKSIGGRSIQSTFGSGGGGGGLYENGYRSLTDSGLWISNNSSKLYKYLSNTEITIACWVKPLSSGKNDNGTIFYGSLKGTTINSLLTQWYGGFGIYINNNKFRFRVAKHDSNSSYSEWDSREIDYDNWYLLSWSLKYNGISKFDTNEHYTKITITKENGELQKFESNDFYYPYFTKTYDFTIGCWTCETWQSDSTNSERNFDGYINDFRIYNKVLNNDNTTILSNYTYQDNVGNAGNVKKMLDGDELIIDDIEIYDFGDTNILVLKSDQINNQTIFNLKITDDIENCSILIIGGGGAGGLQSGGGGGAGGLLFLENIEFKTNTYNIAVGKGSSYLSKNGNGRPVPNYPDGKRGFDSFAFGYVSIGGGNGGGDDYPGSQGGSGGGGSDNTNTLSTSAGGYGIQSYYDSINLITLTPSDSHINYGYGSNGGAGSDNTKGGGGGGGAGGSGYNNNDSNQRVGGLGIDLSQYFGTNIGDNGWFAGGGGGSSKNDQNFTGYSNGGVDLLGGGGKGAYIGYKLGESGMKNTGGGGGGFFSYDTGNIDQTKYGNGGSGVVIIKIPSHKTNHFTLIKKKLIKNIISMN